MWVFTISFLSFYLFNLASKTIMLIDYNVVFAFVFITVVIISLVTFDRDSCEKGKKSSWSGVIVPALRRAIFWSAIVLFLSVQLSSQVYIVTDGKKFRSARALCWYRTPDGKRHSLAPSCSYLYNMSSQFVCLTDHSWTLGSGCKRVKQELVVDMYAPTSFTKVVKDPDFIFHKPTDTYDDRRVSSFRTEVDYMPKVVVADQGVDIDDNDHDYIYDNEDVNVYDNLFDIEDEYVF